MSFRETIRFGTFSKYLTQNLTRQFQNQLSCCVSSHWFDKETIKELDVRSSSSHISFIYSKIGHFFFLYCIFLELVATDISWFFKSRIFLWSEALKFEFVAIRSSSLTTMSHKYARNYAISQMYKLLPKYHMTLASTNEMLYTINRN